MKMLNTFISESYKPLSVLEQDRFKASSILGMTIIPRDESGYRILQ